MDDEQKARLVDTITAAAKTAAGTVDGIGTLNVMPMENLPPMRAMSLVERHLISPEFARNGKGSALLLSCLLYTSLYDGGCGNRRRHHGAQRDPKAPGIHYG